jgi:two-component sensor histidine kinase
MAVSVNSTYLCPAVLVICMMKTNFLLIGLIAVSTYGVAQTLTNQGVGVNPLIEKPQAELINRLRLAGEDTGKVKLLLSLCVFHWRNERNLDSIRLYAEAARKLSLTLRFGPGYNDACFFLCKVYLLNERISDAKGLLSPLPRDQQARLLIVIGEHYLFRPGMQKRDLDSCYPCFSQALLLARSIGSEDWKKESMIALGKYYFSSGKFDKGRECFMEMINDYHRMGDRPTEAHMWSELGIYMPDTDSTFKEELFAHGNALKLYHALKDTANETSVLQDIGAVYALHGNFSLAKNQFLLALQLRKASGNKKLCNILWNLGWIYYSMGDLNEALGCALEEERVSAASGIESGAGMLLGQIYGDYGQAEESLHYLLPVAGKTSDKWNYYVSRKIVEQYIHLGKPNEALSYILKFEGTNPAVRVVDRQTLAAAKGDCYSLLDNPKLAERYYLQMIRLENEVQMERSRDVVPVHYDLSGREAYYKIANFYAGSNKYAIAGRYLARALRATTISHNKFFASNLERNIRWLQFKIDSADGNYGVAIRDYEKYTALNDSIFNAAKARQLQLLQVQFETEKKENEIRSKDQEIRTLRQNDLLRQANGKKDRFIWRVTVTATGILLVLGGWSFSLYVQKQRSSNLITHRNEQLQRLLSEKEWLLKEVHHRVKNNLYTVICLLESQAAYLENDALSAIENSQHRIYAMSLIHQKIYQTDDMKTIEMADYLPEFIQYLKDSYGNSRHIGFELTVDALPLDVSRAVPIALIVNEAVTNSIKHAFPGKATGMIRVSLERSGDDILLEIADNGIGIPQNIGEAKFNSLGLQLLRGLSEDINGRITFENCDGARITVAFNMDPLVEENKKWSLSKGKEV